MYSYCFPDSNFIFERKDSELEKKLKSNDTLILDTARRYLKSKPRDLLRIQYIQTRNSIIIKPGNGWTPKIKLEDGEGVIYLHPKIIPIILTIVLLGTVYTFGSAGYKEYLEIKKLRIELDELYKKGKITKKNHIDSVLMIENFEKSIYHLSERQLIELQRLLKESESIIQDDSILSIKPSYSLEIPDSSRIKK